jgi:hypothetical protein
VIANDPFNAAGFETVAAAGCPEVGCIGVRVQAAATLRTSATIVQCRAEFRLDMRLLWSLDVDTKSMRDASRLKKELSQHSAH